MISATKFFLATGLILSFLMSPARAGVAWGLAPLRERLQQADLVVVGEIVAESDYQGELMPSKAGSLSVVETLKGKVERRELVLIYTDIVGGHCPGQVGIWILQWDPRVGAFRCHEKADPEPLEAREQIRRTLG